MEYKNKEGENMKEEEKKEENDCALEDIWGDMEDFVDALLRWHQKEIAQGHTL